VGPFHHGLVVVFLLAAGLAGAGAADSLLRGGIYIHDAHADDATTADSLAVPAGPTGGAAHRDGGPADDRRRWASSGRRATTTCHDELH
jgi:hypothetical protein